MGGTSSRPIQQLRSGQDVGDPKGTSTHEGIGGLFPETKNLQRGGGLGNDRKHNNGQWNPTGLTDINDIFHDIYVGDGKGSGGGDDSLVEGKKGRRSNQEPQDEGRRPTWGGERGAGFHTYPCRT